jgi:hypothetical protein
MQAEEAQKWRLLYTAIVSPTSVSFTPLTAAEQASALQPYRVYTATYTKAGGSADGLHELSLDLSATFATATGGTISFVKTTDDYMITARVTVNGPPPHVLLPGVSCPVGVAVDVTQFGLSGTGAVSPQMLSKSASMSFTYTPGAVYNVPDAQFEETVYPYVRWPDSPYVRQVDFPQPDGTYNFLSLQAVYEEDLSSQNIGFITRGVFVGSELQVQYLPGSPQPVRFFSGRVSSFSGATPEIVGTAGGKATVMVSGTVGPFPGAAKWVNGASGLLREPVNGDDIVFSQASNSSFRASIPSPPLAARQYVSRYMDNMQVSAIIEHP